jgi:hypothetical protein
VACPYFIPSAPHPRELWPHRFRLPLGDGFSGICGARVQETPCDDETLRSQCNLGYAECVHLPVERELDAIRFHVRSENSTILRVQFACEHQHQPAFAGELRYDRSSKIWVDPPDPRLVHLAEAAVRAWFGRHGDIAPPAPANSIATHSALLESNIGKP